MSTDSLPTSPSNPLPLPPALPTNPPPAPPPISTIIDSKLIIPTRLLSSETPLSPYSAASGSQPLSATNFIPNNTLVQSPNAPTTTMTTTAVSNPPPIITQQVSTNPLPFTHATPQNHAVTLLETRIAIWKPLLESTITFFTAAKEEEEKKVHDVNRYILGISEVERKGNEKANSLNIGNEDTNSQGNVSSAHFCFSGLEPVQEQVASKDVAAKLNLTLKDMAEDHAANIKIIQTQFIEELERLNKEVRKKSRYFSEQLDPILKRTAAYRSKFSSDLISYAHTLAEFSHDASMKANVPQDPWITASSHATRVRLTVDAEHESGKQLKEIMEEMGRFDGHLTSRVGKIVQDYESWKARRWESEKSRLALLNQLFNPSLNPPVDGQSWFFAAFLNQHGIAEALGPSFTIDNYLPKSHVIPPIEGPLYESFVSQNKKGIWKVAYVVLSRYGFLHIFRDVASNLEDPQVIKDQGIMQTLRNPTEHSAPKTYFLRQSHVEVKAAEEHQLEIMVPRVERGFLGLGKKKERGFDTLIFRVEPDTNHPDVTRDRFLEQCSSVLLANSREEPKLPPP